MKKELISDVDLAVKIICEAGAWLQGSGIKTYIFWHPDYLTKERLSEAYRAQPKDFCVMLIDGEAVGAGLFLQEDKFNLYSDSKQVKAVYLSKLAVGIKYKGNNYSKDLIDLMKEKAKFLGYDRIRLEADPNQNKLAEIYINNGFNLIATNYYPEYDSRASLFECLL